jgi:hypothetical protein
MKENVEIDRDIIDGLFKGYEIVCQKMDPMYEDAKSAITIVRKFIKSKDLVIYGGTAIDFALRLHGDAIYKEETLAIPDLDFYSENHVSDAYELANLLYAAGFKDTRVIRAFYVQTMRVDIGHGHYVADISYAPKGVYVKTLEYESMKIVHPWVQYIDMHSSLTFPYDNPPTEVILSRWKKDIQRYNKLYQYYPLLPPTGNIQKFQPIQLRPAEMRLVLCGIPAYSLVYDAFIRMLEATPASPKVPKEVVKIEVDPLKLKLGSLEGMIELVSHNPEKTYSELGIVLKKFAPLFHYRPTRYTNDRYIINSTLRRLVCYHSYHYSDTVSYRTVSCQYLLMQFVSEYIVTNKPIYAHLYLSVLKMIEVADELVVGIHESGNDEIFNGLLLSAPFFPTHKVYGSDNMPDSMRVQLRSIETELAYHTKSQKETPFKLPMNYYPSRGLRESDREIELDPEFFIKDGRELPIA